MSWEVAPSGKILRWRDVRGRWGPDVAPLEGEPPPPPDRDDSMTTAIDLPPTKVLEAIHCDPPDVE